MFRSLFLTVIVSQGRAAKYLNYLRWHPQHLQNEHFDRHCMSQVPDIDPAKKATNLTHLDSNKATCFFAFDETARTQHLDNESHVQDFYVSCI